MNRLLIVVMMAPLAALGISRAAAPFADVPPCHWAAEAVAGLADQEIFIGFPPDDAYLGTNALRQVFEGLRCDDPSWSQRFVSDAPADLGQPPGLRLLGFDLDATVQQRDVGRIELAYDLTVHMEHDGERSTARREGTLAADRSELGWRVRYADLAALDLPLFPH